MPGFMRHAAIKGLKAALEALMKMVDRRFVYITKKQPIFRPTVLLRSINTNKPNKELTVKSSLSGTVINFKRGISMI